MFESLVTYQNCSKFFMSHEHLRKSFFSTGNNGGLSQKNTEKMWTCRHLKNRNYQQQFSNCQLSCAQKSLLFWRENSKNVKSERWKRASYVKFDILKSGEPDRTIVPDWTNKPNRPNEPDRTWPNLTEPDRTIELASNLTEPLNLTEPDRTWLNLTEPDRTNEPDQTSGSA